MAETKVVKIEGVDVTMHRCWNHKDPRCKGWFNRKRTDQESCSNRCAVRKSKAWQKQHTFKTSYKTGKNK